MARGPSLTIEQKIERARIELEQLEQRLYEEQLKKQGDAIKNTLDLSSLEATFATYADIPKVEILKLVAEKLGLTVEISELAPPKAVRKPRKPRTVKKAKA